MFDAGVKETLCTRCTHREVCTYKQDYLDILKAVENLAITRDTPDGKITIVPEKQFSETARKIRPLL